MIVALARKLLIALWHFVGKAWCPRASSSVPLTEGKVAQEHLKDFGPDRTVCDGSPMTVRGGGVPAESMAFTPFVRMGPPPRRFAADAASLHHGKDDSPPPETRYYDGTPPDILRLGRTSQDANI